MLHSLIGLKSMKALMGFLLVACVPASCQTSMLTGTVTDAARRSTPIAGADVTIVGGNGKVLGTTISGTKGEYSVRGLRRGEQVTAKYRKMGYSPDPRSYDLALSQAETIQDARLFSNTADSSYWHDWSSEQKRVVESSTSTPHERAAVYYSAWSDLDKFQLSRDAQAEAAKQLAEAVRNSEELRERLMAALAARQPQQVQESYLDVYTVQVKPEKRADFDAISKKIVAANRQNSGDNWLAMETVYGPGNRVTFVSTRQSYGEIEKATGMFYEAMQETYGKAASDKMVGDFNQCLESSRSEIRRRRWDLSSNAPTDPAGYAKMIAGSRWLRTTAIHVRPGQSNSFEAILKNLNVARDKASPPQTILVSQAVAGQEGTVYYVTSLQTSLAGFDEVPSVQQLLGDEGYDRFLKASAETVANTETSINRFIPEISNAPEEVAASSPDFWRPKAAAPVHAKAANAKSATVNAKETSTLEDNK